MGSHYLCFLIARATYQIIDHMTTSSFQVHQDSLMTNKPQKEENSLRDLNPPNSIIDPNIIHITTHGLWIQAKAKAVEKTLSILPILRG